MIRDTKRLVALLIDAFGAIDDCINGHGVGPGLSAAHDTNALILKKVKAQDISL